MNGNLDSVHRRCTKQEKGNLAFEFQKFEIDEGANEHDIVCHGYNSLFLVTIP